MENKYLCWVNLVGEASDGLKIYEFLFTSDPNEVWGDDFENKPMGLCNNLLPYENSYDLKKMIKTNVELDLVQNNYCFGFSDCIDGIVSLAWENIDNYEEYPDYRLVLNYAETYDEVEKKLAEKNIIFEDYGTEQNI